MIVLGVDPGYRNLGLSVIEISDDGKDVTVLHSRNMAVGRATAPMAFAKFLVPALDRLNKDHGPIDAVASETPPFIEGALKTTAYLWAVTAIIVCWAQIHDMRMKHTSPLSIKRGVCRTLKMKWDQKFIPRKSHVKEAVGVLVGDTATSSHENDATFAALLLYSKAVPEA